MKFVWLFLVLLLIFALSVTLGANNDQWVDVNYMLGSIKLRLSTLLAMLLGGGLLLGWLISAFFHFRLVLQHKSLQRKFNKLQQQYDELTAQQRKSELAATTNPTVAS